MSCLAGTLLLNSASSPQHSHQNVVLKEDDTLGTDFREKAIEIKILSFSNRNGKEEKIVLDAYVEMTGNSSKKGKKKAGSNRKEATGTELINSDSARQQGQSARELIK